RDPVVGQGQLLLAPQRLADLGEQLGELDVQGRADRGQQFGRRLLLPALDLGQVPQAHPRAGRDLAQGAALPHAGGAQGLTHDLTQDGYWVTRFDATADVAGDLTVP